VETFLKQVKHLLKGYDNLTENKQLVADWSESSYTEERKEIEYFSLVSVQEINHRVWVGLVATCSTTIL